MLSINIEEEMRRSYLDYSMSGIIGRVLPDVRDGHKPVHRRILDGMRECISRRRRGIWGWTMITLPLSSQRRVSLCLSTMSPADKTDVTAKLLSKPGDWFLLAKEEIPEDTADLEVRPLRGVFVRCVERTETKE